MLALVRSGPWEWALLFHVLGALILIGGLALVVATSLAAERAQAGSSLALRRLTFRTLVLVVVPSYLLMRISAEWVRSEDAFPDDTAWLDVGYIVTDAGILVLLALLVLGWLSARRAARGDTGTPVSARIVSVLAPLYLVALLVAVWAMTTKPD